MGRALRAELEPVAGKRKLGRPLGSTKKNKEEAMAEAETSTWMSSSAARVAVELQGERSDQLTGTKMPGTLRDCCWYWTPPTPTGSPPLSG
eukprot:7442560-Heterocapsa_arctica.AAC.1